MLPFRKPSSRRHVERLIREGVGVREHAWVIVPGSPLDAYVEPIVAWVRRAMGEMRRPNGIDQVALSLACRDMGGRVVCSNSFGVVRPAMFYDDAGLDRVAAFLADVEAVDPGRRYEIVGALLSLGDIAYELKVARAA